MIVCLNIYKTVQRIPIRCFGIVAAALKSEHARYYPHPGTVSDEEGYA